MPPADLDIAQQSGATTDGVRDSAGEERTSSPKEKSVQGAEAGAPPGGSIASFRQ
jgi:hypothetical protein